MARCVHCKNYSVINTPNLLHTHTFYHISVSIEQIWCVYHTAVFTVYVCMCKLAIQPYFYYVHVIIAECSKKPGMWQRSLMARCVRISA